jgi:hypothetical protein
MGLGRQQAAFILRARGQAGRDDVGMLDDGVATPVELVVDPLGIDRRDIKTTW